MAAYFVSDVHLRLDRPERGERLARWLAHLTPADRLVIAGDLCDFWFASRQMQGDPMACRGLNALAGFSACGGSMTIMPGNHDLWLGRFYEDVLGAVFVQEPYEVEADGLRVHVVHGHLLGARRAWKSTMESHAFLKLFGKAPGPMARALESGLEFWNARSREASDRRHLNVFSAYADRLRDRADIVVFGHIHRPQDQPELRPRRVVLGSWQRGSSYLKIDARGASFVVEDPGDDG